MLVDHGGPLSGYHVPGLLCARKFLLAKWLLAPSFCPESGAPAQTDPYGQSPAPCWPVSPRLIQAGQSGEGKGLQLVLSVPHVSDMQPLWEVDSFCLTGEVDEAET